MGFYVPNKLLTNPDLYEPGRKPVGPVRFKRNSDLLKDAILYIPVSSQDTKSNIRDLIGGYSLVPTNGATVQRGRIHYPTNGNDFYSITNATPFAGMSQLTVSLRCNIKNFDAEAMIFACGDNGGPWQIWIDAADWGVYLKHHGTDLFVGSAFPLNRDVHVAMTYDGDRQKAYLDGVKVIDTNVTNGNVSSAVGADDLVIGGSAALYSTQGDYDEILITTNALTDQQIYRLHTDHYNELFESPLGGL